MTTPQTKTAMIAAESSMAMVDLFIRFLLSSIPSKNKKRPLLHRATRDEVMGA
jgi:hypothetical protein